MKIRTSTITHVGDRMVPTLTVHQCWALLEQAEVYHGDLGSYTAPRYHRHLGLPAESTTVDACARIRELIAAAGLQRSDAVPARLANLAAAERHRRRCRLVYDARLPEIRHRRGSVRDAGWALTGGDR